jgi:hypothetical protein
MFDCDVLLDALERELRTSLNSTVTTFVTTARTRLEGAVAEVAEERATALAVVDARCQELAREVEAMHKHKEAQEGRVKLNIGGYRFETSVQALRRIPHTFFDAYFSGRYAQDVCDDGSIFVDRDGAHFGHVLQYMRDGVVSVAEPGARPSVSLLREVKREFGFYCIELVAEQAVEPEQPEIAYVVGGYGPGAVDKASIERYDVPSGQWSAAAAMGNSRYRLGACVLSGELYVTGGTNASGQRLSSVEKYSPLSDTWNAVAPMPTGRCAHAAVVVGSDVYVLGGSTNSNLTASVLKFGSTQGTWSQVAPIPVASHGLAACAVGSNIYVFGGSMSHQMHSSVFKYDTEANEWSTLAAMPQGSECHHASMMDGLVYILGVGAYGHDVLRFDPVSGAWSTLAPTLNDRKYGASFVLGGCLYAAGGNSSNPSVERYDVVRNTWAAVADMLEGRSFFGAVTIGSAASAGEQDLFDSLIVKASRRHP